MSMSERRVHRHIAWLFMIVIVFLTASFGAGLVEVLGELSVAAVCKAAFLILMYAVLVAFPIGTLRWRTVVDDEAVTQHWILNTYRIPLAEITGLERDGDFSRWFLRIHAGERTYEVIPCYVFRRPGGAFSPGPPRTLLAVEADIRSRLDRDV